jgi:hypothetical protein
VVASRYAHPNLHSELADKRAPDGCLHHTILADKRGFLLKKLDTLMSS